MLGNDRPKSNTPRQHRSDATESAQAWASDPALVSDLSMVRDLAELRPDVSPSVKLCSYRGKLMKSVDPHDEPCHPAALDLMAELLTRATAPAFVFPQTLTIEACREAIALMELVRGYIMLGDEPAWINPVSQRCTLGHALSCDTAIWLGDHAAVPPELIWRLKARIPHHFAMSDTLEAVLDLRQRCVNISFPSDLPAPLDQPQSVVVLIPPSCDPRVISQWDRLTNDLQPLVRIAVMPLPDLTRSLNFRGALETITWQTGIACSTGCVDFTQGFPQLGPSLDTLLQRVAIDALITAECDHLTLPKEGWRVRRLGTRSRPRRYPGLFVTVKGKPNESVGVPIPGIVPGLRAHVMRFDGVTLRLWNDRTPAFPDRAQLILQSLRQRVARMVKSP